MAENRDPGLNIETLAEILGELHSIAILIPFADNENMALRAGKTLHIFAECLEIRFPFGNGDEFRAGCNSHINGNKSRLTSHHLHEERPIMALRRIANPVDR